MKKSILFIALALLVCVAGSLVSFSPARTTLPLQLRVEPFCKFTYVDHRGHSIKLSTNITHASSKSLTFIFETGEKLIINFTMIRAGHFVAESHRSKDPQIIFYASPGSPPVPMIGAVIISTVKPVTGNFSHLVSDDYDQLALVAGSFSL